MHIDEGKKFDRRNVRKNIQDGLISTKDYGIFLSKLPDVSDKVFNLEESIPNSQDFESKKDNEIQSKKKGARKKSRGKGK